MSTLRREWSPCKICEHYYNEICDNVVKKGCSFLPSNDFKQYLFLHELKLENITNKWCPKVFFVEKDFTDFNLINYGHGPKNNLLNESYDRIISTLCAPQRGGVYFIPVDKELRDAIYNNEQIMSSCYVKILLISKKINKQTLEYRLDKRFQKEYVEDFIN